MRPQQRVEELSMIGHLQMKEFVHDDLVAEVRGLSEERGVEGYPPA